MSVYLLLGLSILCLVQNSQGFLVTVSKSNYFKSSSHWLLKKGKHECNDITDSIDIDIDIQREKQQKQQQLREGSGLGFASRRSLLDTSVGVGASILTQLAFIEPSNAADGSKKVRAKGAAEYDLEFYMRNLIQGNNDKEGNIQASAPPPSLPSRSLMNTSTSSSSLIQSIINDELNNNCIAIRTLSQVTNVPSSEISQLTQTFRDKVINAKSYGNRAQWQKESMVDEYFFDLSAYCLYRTAAVLTSNDYKLRSQWVNLMGDEIYNSLQPTLQFSKSKPGSLKLSETIPILQQILNIFQSNNFIASYRLGDKNDDYRSGSNLFDTYDDEDIEAGLSVNCLISLFRPATLTSSLQIVGEGSRFIPEFLGTTLAAMWRKEVSGGGLKIEYETYFVDEEYRPNPKDYFPNEQLFQYTLKK